MKTKKITFESGECALVGVESEIMIIGQDLLNNLRSCYLCGLAGGADQEGAR